MKISQETIDVLKNFSAINQNLVIEQGNKISTIAEAKNIMASCEVSETFDKDIGIYDLNEFLSASSLIEDPEFVFGDQSVSIKSDLKVELSAEVINYLRRAGAALNHPIVSITTNANDSKLYLEVKDPSNSSSNVFRHVIDSDYNDDTTFDFQFLISNLKLMPGDYEVSISSKLISHWKCINNSSVEYWIALEKTSVT